MARRLTNDLLLALVLAQAATGLAGWALPVAQIAPLYDLHRALGLALLVVLFWKQWIVRRSLARRWRHDCSICGASWPASACWARSALASPGPCG